MIKRQLLGFLVRWAGSALGVYLCYRFIFTAEADDILFYVIAGLIFSVLMVWHGFVLVDLVKVAKIAGLKISQSYLYLPLIICGIASVHMSIFCIVRRVVEGEK